jgi:hypothetical protein
VQPQPSPLQQPSLLQLATAAVAASEASVAAHHQQQVAELLQSLDNAPAGSQMTSPLPMAANTMARAGSGTLGSESLADAVSRALTSNGSGPVQPPQPGQGLANGPVARPGGLANGALGHRAGQLGLGPGLASASAPVSPAQPLRQHLPGLQPLTPQVLGRSGIASAGHVANTGSRLAPGAVPPAPLGMPMAAGGPLHGGQHQSGSLLLPSLDWGYGPVKGSAGGGHDSWGMLGPSAPAGSSASSGSWQMSDVASIFSSGSGSLGAGGSIWSYNPASFAPAAQQHQPAAPSAAAAGGSAPTSTATAASSPAAAGSAPGTSPAVARVLFPAGGRRGPAAGPPARPSRAPQQAPVDFLCPLTRKLMSDPVVAADGFTYERAAIEAWLAEHGTSPLTRQAVASRELLPNLTMKAAIGLLG